ncbi:hypothetical protein GCM10007079_21310 [Nocardiopsis terrae]|uniref:Uncharacterized protein n=1 Tax=Nocardiopsis terrae TaxID=372655 RepID=A0ABR9HGV6_9ACTN|nr:hypothetical protein [Nocardiopsis terrae]MBE1458255.1 hypothetical protein [Nocardiopsis terrae]GHC81411.1 hypothetical protein GCM10007079_21310 [Nocardiopsis terrae]
MTAPAQGLKEADPRQLGGYRLLGRLRESRLGVVYLGRDAAGERMSVAMLNDAAGIDEPTRERFAQAVRDGWGVAAARTSGRSALWVAVPYEGDGAGAQRFLEEAARGGPLVRQGPVVMPHWAGERGGSAVRWAPWAGRRDSAVAAGEANWWLIGGLGALLALLLLLVFFLYVWMMQFPSPEMPTTGPPDFEQSESAEESEPSPAPGDEGEGEPASPVPTLPGGNGGDGWSEQPEDNL